MQENSLIIEAEIPLNQNYNKEKRENTSTR